MEMLPAWNVNIQECRMSWNSHHQQVASNCTNNNNKFPNNEIKREENTSPQPSLIDCQMDLQFSNLLTPSPQGNDTRIFFDNRQSTRFNLLTPPGLPTLNLQALNIYEAQQQQQQQQQNSYHHPHHHQHHNQLHQHQNTTPKRSSLALIETPSITPPMDEESQKSPKSENGIDKNYDSTSGDEKLDSDFVFDYNAIYKPQYNSHGKMRMHKCKRCDFIAETKADYWIHIESHMNPEKVRRCTVYPEKCPFVTELEHYQEYHIKHHKKEKPFQCEKCNYRCINQSMLSSHMKSHSGLFPYHCGTCGYKTKYCHSLKIHLRKNKNHEPGDVLDEDGNPDPSIIFDVNGKRRGPKSKKRSSGSSRRGKGSSGIKSLLYSSSSQHQKQEQKIQHQQSPSLQQYHQQQHNHHHQSSVQDNQVAATAMLMGQNSNLISNFLSNPLANVLHHNQKLKYDLVLPYLQILAGHHAALNKLVPEQMNRSTTPDQMDNVEINDVSNAMDLSQSQTPRKKQHSFTTDSVGLEDEDFSTTNLCKSDPDAARPSRTTFHQRIDSEKSSNDETQFSSFDDVEPFEIRQPSTIFKTTSTSSSHESYSDKLPNGACEINSNFANVEKLISSVSTGNGDSGGGDKPDIISKIDKNYNNNNNNKNANVSELSELYSCKYCDIYFKNVVLHSLHMGFHSCDDVFKCNMCGERCTTATELFVHLARKAHDKV